jgi:hypothetical protein
MKALLWLHGDRCRILLYNEAGVIIDWDDTWNNRASAEMTVLAGFPDAEIQFVRYSETEKITELNAVWDKRKERSQT